MAKTALNRKKSLFIGKLDLHLWKKTSEMLQLNHSIVWC